MYSKLIIKQKFTAKKIFLQRTATQLPIQLRKNTSFLTIRALKDY